MEGISPTVILAVIVAAVIVTIPKSPAWLRLLFVLLAVFLTWFETSHYLVRQHHGEMNVLVGHPYSELAKHLRGLAEEDKHENLEKELIEMDDNSRDIFDVWLGGDKGSFKAFVDGLTGTNGDANMRVHSTR